MEKQRRLKDWNVVITVREGRYREARKLLHMIGEVAPTEFRNVLVLYASNPTRVLLLLEERATIEPGVRDILSRVVPARLTFSFRDAAEFEQQAREAVLQLLPALSGQSFHVRIHRRGFRHRLSSQEEEQRLDKILLDGLAELGTPGSVTFDNPDAIVAIESVGQRAGLSLWTREELRRYPFLRLD